MYKNKLFFSFLPLLVMVLFLGIGYGYFHLRVEPILVCVAFVAGIIAYFIFDISWDEMQAAIIDKISLAMPAILILWSVGFLIGALIFSGSIPLIIYYGIKLINPDYLLVTAFIITAIVSIITGTSWGSIGTIGVAFIGIAISLNFNLAATAGAVVAGAYFGDKMSPLSDTTNLASMVAGAKLYTHIQHMLYTTVPAAILSIMVYVFLGFSEARTKAPLSTVQTLLHELSSVFNLSIWLLVPVFLILFGSIRKWPIIPTMLAVSLLSIMIGVLFQGFSLVDGFKALVQGFNINMSGQTGSKELMKLLNRGGVVSVTSTTVLIFCAFGFAGIMSVSGMLDNILGVILTKVKSVAMLIASTIASCLCIAFVTGSSYLTILIPGEIFKGAYIKYSLAPRNLSRTLEDSGTVIVPLIPWSAAGAYVSATLGVDTFAYIPYAVLNYAGIFIALFYAVTGLAIKRLSKEEKEHYEQDFHMNKKG